MDIVYIGSMAFWLTRSIERSQHDERFRLGRGVDSQSPLSTGS